MTSVTNMKTYDCRSQAEERLSEVFPAQISPKAYSAAETAAFT